MSVEFGSLFQFIRNGMSVKQDKSGDGIPITRIETIANATVDPSRVGFAGLTEEDCAGWFMEPGDILFSHINSVEHVGKCAVYQGRPEKLVHGMNLLCFRCDQTKITPDFAKYLIRGQHFRTRLSNFINKAVNQASVSIGNLKTIPVSIPSLPEQRRIAAILDQADALRAKRREALVQLNSLTQSIFIEMFGDPATNPKRWALAQLADLVPKGDSINYGVIQPGDDVETGVPMVRVGDLIDGRIRHSALKRIAPSIESAYKRSRLQGDEILVSCVGSIGVVALADSSVKSFNIARAVARIRIPDEANRKYIAAHLSTAHVQNYFTAELRTVSQPTLNIKQISETEIMCPSSVLQAEFARRMASFESFKSAQKASMSELDSLFASLQHRAFRGEL